MNFSPYSLVCAEGNDIIQTLTTTPSILRVELETWKGVRGYAQYSNFKVANEAQNYRIFVQGFSGNVSRDGMDYGNGFGFTTYDKDNDGRDPTSKDCAEERHGAWWHDRCTLTNLNGVYHQEDGYDWEAMSWIEFPDPDRYFTPLRKAKMMIRWIK
ncbi:Angiopoietin-related protein 7 [Mizuhopecten yessoensis]|uniref:Angiopoietin-related protein 7 n=1 Tax=Mizuhopecten yessoensis TaxID=6573 RepID=A0A210QFG7_MIZYE|nr:Angiopoietin-related protein 7 [Mizuhopecten yessoensis]